MATYFRTVIAVAAMQFISCNIASANGRSTGVRVSDLPVDAVCMDRQGTEHTLMNVLVAGDRNLFTRVGAAQGTIAFARVEQMTLSSDPGPDGYAAGAVIVGGVNQPVEIKVREDRNDLELTGESPIGMALRIPLHSCKTVSFSSAGQQRSGAAAGPDRQPGRGPKAD